MTRPDPHILLFSYGTLQLPEVQRATYGRLLAGEPDVLVGYRLEPLIISSPEVVGISGLEVHTIARRSGDPGDRVPGMVFRLTAAELAATDRYETDAYARIAAVLASGARAFVYVGPDLLPKDSAST
ncbi:MAG TPA: gamma-glutamylcyclotransferase family protein [Allosphingosinicella sp.]|nr:gamma-glutamylcyclotransferase family protein [Allosphingosinicella sp.]